VAAYEEVVRDSTQEVISFRGRDYGSQAVLDVVSTASVQVDTVRIEPGAPEHSTKPIDVAIDRASGPIARRDVDDRLDVEITDSNDSARGEQCCDLINDAVKVWDHREAVGHCDQVSSLSSRMHRSSVLAKDADVRPAKAPDSVASDLAQRRREIDKKDMLKEVSDPDELVHDLNVIPRAAADVEPYRPPVAGRPATVKL